MKENKLVSVIIPCYNQGAYIDETLKSVFDQNYLSIEIIVVDDGSNDPFTIEKIAKIQLDSRIRLIQTENNGVSAARNIGIKNSNGEYIFPLDADDLISETYISKAVSVLENQPNIDLVYCRASYFGERTGEIDLGKYSLNSMLCRNQIFNAVLLKKDRILSIQGYDENFKLGWEDWDFYLRYISSTSQIHKIDEILFFYRIRLESRNESLKDDKLKEVEKQLYLKHLETYLDNFSNPISRLREYESNLSRIDELNSIIYKIKKSPTFRIGSIFILPIRIIYIVFTKWIK